MHPAPQSVDRVPLAGQRRRQLDQLIHLPAIDTQRLPGREVAIQRRDPDPGLSSDGLEARTGAADVEHLPGGLEQPVMVPG